MYFSMNEAIMLELYMFVRRLFLQLISDSGISVLYHLLQFFSLTV